MLSLNSLFSDRKHKNTKLRYNNESEAIKIKNEENTLENLMNDANT